MHGRKLILNEVGKKKKTTVLILTVHKHMKSFFFCISCFSCYYTSVKLSTFLQIALP